MISYEPFFRTLREKGISSYKLAKMGFPMSNYHAIRRGKHISTQTLDALCNILNCEVSDIIEFQREPGEQSYSENK